MISEYHKTITLHKLWTFEPVKSSEIDVKEGVMNHYEPEKINDLFDDKYIEYKSKYDENISFEKYLWTIIPFLGNIKDELKKSDKWKTYLTIKVNFM